MDNGGKTKKSIQKKVLMLSIILGAVSLGFLVLTIAAAHAVSFEDVSQTLGLGTADLKSTVINVLKWVLGLLGIVAVIFMLYGGYMWLTSAGNEERIRRAKRILINTTIGLVIILLAWAIVAFVLNFGNDVTNPGGGQCTEGTSQGCWDCVGGDWVYNPNNPGCQPPQDTFEVRNIATSCQDPGFYRENVFLCSGVTIVFNKVVKTDNLQSLVETNDPLALKIEQCDTGSSFSNCVRPSQPNTPPPTPPLFNPVPPYRSTIEYSGSAPTGNRAEFIANGKSITFLHAQQLFPANTYFKLTIPKSITDTSGRALSACRYQNGTDFNPCTDDGTSYSWIFHVGDQNDSQAPTLKESYPRSDPANRDRNVSRTPIIWARFSEAIAPWTITEDNIKIYGFDPNGQPDAQGNGGTRLTTPIDGLPPDPDNYDVFINSSGDGFELSFKNGFQLDAFKWYEIEVNNLTDLCSNVQTPAPLTWRFETNGVGAGVALKYPTNAFACPNTQVFVLFNTSMYDPATSSCAVLPSGGGFVTSGTDLPPRNHLAVEDDYPGSGDPNDFCKKYSYLPTSAGLAANTNYHVNVQTRYQINQQGDTLSADWNFSVKPPGQCADGPFITELSPNTGPTGTCLSVLGGNFDPNGNNQGAGDGDKLTFTNTSALDGVKRWSQNVIVTSAPNGPTGTSPVQVTVHYPAPIGDLASNTMDYNYTSGNFDGACLIQLNPHNGLRNQSYQLIGENFNPASTVKQIHFGSTMACQNPPGSSCWSSDTVANSTVPGSAPIAPPDSLVWVVNDAGTSNKLPFTVNEVPPGTFQVVDFTPNCTSSCPNAAVRARFSTSLDPASVTDNTVELYKCSDASCGLGTLTEVQTNLQYTPGTQDVFFAQTDGLETPDVWYRAVIHGGSGGVKSAPPGSLELGDLNFDFDGTGGPDSSSWIFKTASTTETCDLNTVECHPPTVSIPLNGTRGLQSRAFSAPNSCNPAGQELDPWQYAWSWRSGDASRVTVNPAGPDPQTTATGVQATRPGAPVNVETATSGKNAFCSVTVTTNTCVTDEDCVNSPAGTCTGSRCVAGVCTPTVTNISPLRGAVGDWLTVNGCYFDNYVDGQSKVLFLQSPSTPDLVGLWPQSNICGPAGSTWHDRQIIVEVPNKRDGNVNDPTNDVLTTGPLRVIRGTDLTSTDSLQSFDPTGPIHPGICKVTPGGGQAGITRIKVQGQNFGSPPPGDDKGLVFYDGTAGGATVAGVDTNWVSDTEVNNILVPQSAINNDGTNTNAPWSGTTNELYLKNNGQQSNLVNFDVIPPSCSICTTDTQCGGAGVAQGCGVQGPFSCCADRPSISAFGPTNPPSTCRNAALSASFTIAMDRSTINPSTVKLRNLTLGADIPLNINDFRFPNATSFLVEPGALEANTQYQVTILGDNNINQDPAVPEGVLSTTHVGMYQDKTWTFTTNDSICQLDHVSLSPDAFSFTGFGQTQNVTALTYDQSGQAIAPIPGVYDWHWQWSPTNDPVATVSNSDSPDQQITSVANGTTTVKATAVAGVGWTGSKSGVALVSVSACVAPWPDVPPYEDPSAPSTEFSTWYCRDQGNLPAVSAVAGSHQATQSGVDELLREFFFEDPNVNPATNKHDAVGMLVWENEDQLSPAAWYQKKFNKAAPGATSKVDGYEAMRVGTTTYIAGTNLIYDFSQHHWVLYTNMYVLGYNDDAGQEITSIFNQMLNNLKLNINGSNFAYDGQPDYLQALQQVRRDTKRVADLHDYGQALDVYSAKKGSFPDLPAGSYITGMSTSTWPSWDERLTTALKSTVSDALIPHVDPKNDLLPACTDPFNPNTCWDDVGKRFSCPADSHIYAYQAPAGGATYDMFAHLEYLGNGNWQTGDVNPCSAPSTCDCFNYQLTGTAQGHGGSSDTTAPTPPGNLRATTAGTDRIDLSWNVSSDTGGSGVQSYELYRSRDGTSWESPPAVVAHPNTTYSETGLTPNTTYFFEAKARDFAGNLSGPSNIAEATTQAGSDITAPGNVTNLNGTVGDQQVTITWTDPPDTDLAGIQMYRKNGPGTFLRTDPQAVAITPDATPGQERVVVTGLTNGQVYTFGFFPYDEVPNFASGAFIQLTPTGGGGTYSANVVNFTATGFAWGIRLSWQNPSDPAYGGVIIRRKVDDATPFTGPTDGAAVADLTTGVVSYDDTSATNSSSVYYYAAYAHDTSTPRHYASGVFASGSPTAGGSVQNVGGFTATPGDAQIFLTWSNPPAPYTGVMIRRSTTSAPRGITDGTLVSDVAAPAASYLDTGLTNGTLYYYTAFAHDNVPNYATGTSAQATPENGPPQITGVNVPLAFIGFTQVTIVWQTNEPTTSIVEIGTDPSQYEVGLFSDGRYVTNHQLTVPFNPVLLQKNTVYHFRVSAEDPAGNHTTDVDHRVMTSFSEGASGEGEHVRGFFENWPVATWNGSTNGLRCDNNCNQYYTCDPTTGIPDCSDSRNTGIGASTTACGALAIADCVDGTADLGHGANALTFDGNPLHQHILWGGTSSLFDESQENSICSTCSTIMCTQLPISGGTWSRSVNNPGAGPQALIVDCGSTTGLDDVQQHTFMIRN